MEKINAEVFLKASELLNFRKTADALGYTQAGIAYIISAMEDELGVKLFRREYGGVRLTSEGAALEPLIRSVYYSERNLKEAADKLSGKQVGSVSVVSISSFFATLLPKAVAAFQQEYPLIKVSVAVIDSMENGIKKLNNGTADIIIGEGISEGKLDTRILFEDPFMALLPEDHPLAGGKCFPLAELANYPYIANPDDEVAGINALFEMTGSKPNTIYTMNDDLAAFIMVSSGLGISVASRLLVDAAKFRMKALPFDVPIKKKVNLTTLKSEERSHAASLFADYLATWVNENYNPEEI